MLTMMYIIDHFFTFGLVNEVLRSKYSNDRTPRLNSSLIENMYFLTLGGIPFSFSRC
jgi:hypothetical protein